MADTFVNITFVADELLTSTKMNLLAANQAGFHSGAALGDGIIVSRHVPNGELGVSKINLTTFPAAQQSYIAVTSFANNWVNYDATALQGCEYMKDSLGFVHIRGLLKNGSLGMAAFTLPAGYRPIKTNSYTVPSNATTGVVQVLGTGAVVPLSGSNVFVYLDGIHYKAEA